jgi:hypothetical protein
VAEFIPFLAVFGAMDGRHGQLAAALIKRRKDLHEIHLFPNQLHIKSLGNLVAQFYVVAGKFSLFIYELERLVVASGHHQCFLSLRRNGRKKYQG